MVGVVAISRPLFFVQDEEKGALYSRSVWWLPSLPGLTFAELFRLSWKWKERSAAKIAERTREESTKALPGGAAHNRGKDAHLHPITMAWRRSRVRISPDPPNFLRSAPRHRSFRSLVDRNSTRTANHYPGRGAPSPISAPPPSQYSTALPQS